MKPPIDEAAWRPWVAHVAEALGVEAGVSPNQVHRMTSRVAAAWQRAMAPVAAYLWGLAVATHPDRDPAELAEDIIALLPES